MFTIKTLNKIASVGTDRFDKARFVIDDTAKEPDAIIVRSASMLDYNFNDSLLCIARAGAGYNNIPADECAKHGIVVFNTPGANANGVKELVICSLLLASRDIIGGITWAKTIADRGDEVPALVEKGKSDFGGPEITGKTLGLQGVGAVGAKVAKAAHSMGMTVYGFDPYLSDELKTELGGIVRFVGSEEELYALSDYLSLHLPYNSETKGQINAKTISGMKDGIRIINIARGEIVCDDDMIAALENGKVSRYVTDFPNAKTAKTKGIIAIPHLGASTPESEDNCAVMAADQISEYLLNGNIINSVNLPNIKLERSGKARAVVISAADNFAALLDSASTASVTGSASKARNGYFTAVIDVQNAEGLEEKLRSVDGVLKVRVL